MPAHRDDIPLDLPRAEVPQSLTKSFSMALMMRDVCDILDDELSQALAASILVRLRHHPSCPT